MRSMFQLPLCDASCCIEATSWFACHHNNNALFSATMLAYGAHALMLLDVTLSCLFEINQVSFHISGPLQPLKNNHFHLQIFPNSHTLVFFLFISSSCSYSTWHGSSKVHFCNLESFCLLGFWGQRCHNNDTFHNHGDTVLGNASTFLGVSAWYVRAMSNSKQRWCRHQAGVETPLELASIWLAHQCLILHRSFTQRGRPPSRAQWRRVLSTPYCYTALLWVFLMPAWWQWN